MGTGAVRKTCVSPKSPSAHEGRDKKCMEGLLCSFFSLPFFSSFFYFSFFHFLSISSPFLFSFQTPLMISKHSFATGLG